MNVVLVTHDERLKLAVQAARPPGATLSVLGAADFRRHRGAPDALWLDLDALEDGDLPVCARYLYFYQTIPALAATLPPGEFIRKPCASAELVGRWAELIAQHSADEAADAPSPFACDLPGWVLEFQDLEFRELCRKCVRRLPRRMGYRDGSLYLFDARRSLLTLAGTSLKLSLELAVRVDESATHFLAAVARQRAAIRADRLADALRERGLSGVERVAERAHEPSLVAPLAGPAGLVGVAWLLGGEQSALTLNQANAACAFLGAALDAAIRFDAARTEARVDELTGLYNYRWMREVTEREIRRAARFSSKLAVILLDLDGFKAVNDSLGHAAGDALLRHAAGRVRAALRQIDYAARLGGDEFAVLLPETDFTGARQVAERVLQSVRNSPAAFRDRPLPISVSVGVAQWSAGMTVDALLEAADAAMYRAKRDGRDCISCDPDPANAAEP